MLACCAIIIVCGKCIVDANTISATLLCRCHYKHIVTGIVDHMEAVTINILENNFVKLNYIK